MSEAKGDRLISRYEWIESWRHHCIVRMWRVVPVAAAGKGFDLCMGCAVSVEE